MWKIGVGFALFAAFSLFVIVKGGDKIEMGGEQHGAETSAPAAATPAGGEAKKH